jgi:hypothetical protein
LLNLYPKFEEPKMSFSFEDPNWRPFPRRGYDANLASNELWHNISTKAGALICPRGDRRPEFIVAKSGLDHLRNAKRDGKITEGYVVLVEWTDTGRVIASVTPVDDAIATLKNVTPNQGRGLYGPYYWLTADGISADETPF